MFAHVMQPARLLLREETRRRAAERLFMSGILAAETSNRNALRHKLGGHSEVWMRVSGWGVSGS